MKFQAYQQQVGLSALNSPAGQVSGDINAYGGNGGGYNSMTAALGQMQQVAAKEQEDKDNLAVMNAHNQIMTNITAGLYGEKGLLTTGIGANAVGLTDKVIDYIDKASMDVIGKQNKRVAWKLKSNLKDNMYDFQRNAAAQERNERTKFETSQYEAALLNNNNLAGLNYGDAETMTNLISSSLNLVKQRASSQGWDGNTLISEERNVITSHVKESATAAINQDDFDTASRILAAFKSDMEQDTYNKLYNVVNQKQKIKTRNITANDIVSQCKRSDGTIDYVKAYKLVDDMNGINAAKTIKQKVETANADVFTKSKEIANQYANASYRLGGTGEDGTLDCGSYTNKVLCAADSPIQAHTADGQAYEAEQQGLFYTDRSELKPGDLVFWSGTYDATPTNDISQSGDNGSGAYKGITHVGIVQDDGTAMQMGNHGLRPMKLEQYNIAGFAHTGGNQVQEQEMRVSAYDPEENEKMKELIRALGRDNDYAINQQHSDYIDSIKEQIRNAGGLAAAENIIENAGNNLKANEWQACKNFAKSCYPQSGSSGNEINLTDIDPVKYPEKYANSQLMLFDKQMHDLYIQWNNSSMLIPDDWQKRFNESQARLNDYEEITGIVPMGGHTSDWSKHDYSNNGDGGMWAEITQKLENGAEYSDIADALEARNYSEDEIEKIMGGIWK